MVPEGLEGLSGLDVIAWDTESLARKIEGETWEQYRDRCGISVAVVTDVFTEKSEFYTPMDERPRDLSGLFQRVVNADVAVTFNGNWWDLPLLSKTVGSHLNPRNAVDVYAVIKASEGGILRGKGQWKLDKLAQRTFLEGKTGDGAMAPTLAAEERWGQLFEYVLQDGILTARLFKHMAKYGYVIGPGNRVVEVGNALRESIRRTGSTAQPR